MRKTKKPRIDEFSMASSATETKLLVGQLKAVVMRQPIVASETRGIEIEAIFLDYRFGRTKPPTGSLGVGGSSLKKRREL